MLGTPKKGRHENRLAASNGDPTRKSVAGITLG
jgi:hypothetical protein